MINQIVNDRSKLTKQQRINLATQHHQEMLNKYSEQINECAKNTVIHTEDNTPKYGDNDLNTIFSLVPLDSVSALFKLNLSGDKIAVMNFASFTTPGGLYLSGSNAQEECLCFESILYEVLTKQNTFYSINQSLKNRGLYVNRALYTPNVLFERNGINTQADVLTIASPNQNILRYHPNLFTVEENTEALLERIKFARDILAYHQVKYFIAGAFGCGVFKQNPFEVAKLFIKIFIRSSCDKVIFAIPPGYNYQAFYKVLVDFMDTQVNVLSYINELTIKR